MDIPIDSAEEDALLQKYINLGRSVEDMESNLRERQEKIAQTIDELEEDIRIRQKNLDLTLENLDAERRERRTRAHEVEEKMIDDDLLRRKVIGDSLKDV